MFLPFVACTLTWLEYKIARLTVAPTFLVLFDFSTFFALLYFPPLFDATSRSRDRCVNLFLFLFARLAVCTFVPLCQMSFDPCLFFAHLKFKALTKLVFIKICIREQATRHSDPYWAVQKLPPGGCIVSAYCSEKGGKRWGEFSFQFICFHCSLILVLDWLDLVGGMDEMISPSTKHDNGWDMLTFFKLGLVAQRTKLEKCDGKILKLSLTRHLSSILPLVSTNHSVLGFMDSGLWT